MMRLADITMFYARESGGVKRYLTQKHRWFGGHAAISHHLLVPGPEDSRDGDVHTIASPPIPFGHGYRLPIRLGHWARALESLAPDLIEAGDPYQLAWIALDSGQRLGIPVVGFYHSDLPRLLGSRLGRGVARLAETYIADLYRRFDLVLAPSRVMVMKLRALGVTQARHQPLGVDVDRFRPGLRDPNLRKELELPDGARLLIYAGRFAQEKNLPLLVSALGRLGRPYYCLLVGSGRRPPSHPRIRVWPYQSDAGTLARLLASADVLVHPGDKETFGLVVLEAMACGRPVVGMAAGAVPELLQPAWGITARPHDPAALAAAIAAIYGMDMEAMGKAARMEAETRYRWDLIFRQLLAQYAALPGFEGRVPVTEPAHAPP